MALEHRPTLEERLATTLPTECRFNIHHLSTPPTQSPAIFAAPPGEKPDYTYCESHFLSVSIISEDVQTQVFAIEVLIYTTEYLTTLFVSKADSTGYLHLLNLPKGTPSPLRTISTVFLTYLIEERRRSDRRLILSLFARAQNQYLFPGSIENSHKHVLDDRDLIKWWCKVVDPLLGAYQNDSGVLADKKDGITRDEPETKCHGFLRVPGCDIYETRGFLPRDNFGRVDVERWSTTDPLLELRKSPSLPERCLIPRFPDDPKARFVEELDDELPDEVPPSQSQTQDDASKKQKTGRWRSVTSLEQFWEMMSFRQECSSGRLVGFLWATFQPAKMVGSNKPVDMEERSRNPARDALPTPLDSQHLELSRLPPQSPLHSDPAPEAPLITKTPPISPSKRSPAPAASGELALPEETKYYYWPRSSRGEVILSSKEYERFGKLLLRLDYADEKSAADSTRKWIDEVAERSRVKSWGRVVVGSPVAMDVMNGTNGTNPKKRAADGDGNVIVTQSNGIKTLSAGLVRKKAKVASHVGTVSTQEAQTNGKA